MLYRRPPIHAGEIRRIAYSESVDLVHWTQPTQIITRDELDPYSLYGMSVGHMDPDRRDPQHFDVAFLRSADGGATWTKTADITVPEARGAMEPSVAEVVTGSLYCAMRNKSGYLYETWSADGGRSRTAPAGAWTCPWMTGARPP